jgi:hypothetical protein
MHVEINLGFCRFAKCTKFIDTRVIIPSGKHGATTENTKRYIDFAAKNGFDGVLVEGWNVDGKTGLKLERRSFDFTTHPDFDITAISAYAKSKKRKMIMHHETSGFLIMKDI